MLVGTQQVGLINSKTFVSHINFEPLCAWVRFFFKNVFLRCHYLFLLDIWTHLGHGLLLGMCVWCTYQFSIEFMVYGRVCGGDDGVWNDLSDDNCFRWSVKLTRSSDEIWILICWRICFFFFHLLLFFYYAYLLCRWHTPKQFYLGIFECNIFIVLWIAFCSILLRRYHRFCGAIEI